MRTLIYRILDAPWIYRLAQVLLAPGGEAAVVRKLRRELTSISASGSALDVGCGPASWLWRVGLDPLGLDFTPSYIQKYCASGHLGVIGAAQALPFPSGHFQSVWSIGLLHHLSDEVAKQVIEEMARVCQGDGWVVILDAVMPSPAWRRPIAYVLRRMDRGGFVRQEAALERIVRSAAGNGATQHRCTYTMYGHELLIFRFQPRSPQIKGQRKDDSAT